LQQSVDSARPVTNGAVAGLPPLTPIVEPLETVSSLVARGRAAMGQRHYPAAAGYFGRADALGKAPDGAPKRLLNRAIRQLVPRWHFAMINDHDRNAAYQAAIAATVRPGDLVLDIGTGSGLLSLLAAQAGAEMVISCEAEPLIADVAREIIAANGYESRIKVIDNISTDLRVGIDMPARADVLVTEIFDCALLGEDALPAMEHARRELLTEDARMVPGRGRLWGQLISSERLRMHNHASVACGFDVSGFNRFSSLEYFSTYLDNYPYQALTEPFPLLSLDFGVDCPAGEELLKAVPITDGRCDAVAMWFDLDLAPGVALSNGPSHRDSHWRQAVQTFAAPLHCEAGLPVPLYVSHDRERILVTPVD
jgi:protein arginine N-methyltransferase 7